MNRQSENNDLNRKFENYTYPVDDSNWEAISAGIPYGNAKGLLSGKFASYAVQPSKDVWHRIDAVLRPSSGRRTAAWWWIGAAASILLLAVFTYVKYPGTTVDKSLAEKQVKTENQKESNTPAKTRTPTATPNESKPSEKPSNSAFAETTPQTENSELSSESAFKSASMPMDGKEDQILADLRSVKKEAHPLNNSTAFLNPQLVPLESELLEAQAISIIDSDIQIDLAEAVLVGQVRTVSFAKSEVTDKKVKSSPFYDGTEKRASNEYSILAGSQLAFGGSTDQTNADYSAYADGTAVGIGVSNEFAALSESVTYSTPVYYGVNGEIEFLQRLAVGTGLGYLQMRKSSEYTYGGQQSLEIESQNRYLSIPAYLKFDFIHKPKFSAYTTLGNAYDIQIWQQTTSKTFLNGELTGTDTSNKNEQGNQANIYTGLGMTFKFTKHFGLYAEGSLLRYYYTSNPNFYSQQNLWPGLRFGAVVSF